MHRRATALPDFDSSLFLAGLLDPRARRQLHHRPVDLREVGQRCVEDTGVLVTELPGPDGVLEVTDAMTLHSGADLDELVPSGRGELLRLARVLSGWVEVVVRLAPLDPVSVTREGGAWRIRWSAVGSCTCCCGARTS